MYLLMEFISVYLTDVLDTSKIYLKIIFSVSWGDFIFIDEMRKISFDYKQSLELGGKWLFWIWLFAFGFNFCPV